jgi:pyruvate dehydrogenase E2 component (dihydrolipoamide acetyltransferase)
VSGVLPALLPPRALAFGIGALERTPVVRGDAVVPGVRLRCTLAADPSAVDEATAARVIAALRRYLEDPIQMLF